MALPLRTSSIPPNDSKTKMLPQGALSVFYGSAEMPRLTHHFLPRILAQQGQVLYLDGANQISPLLIARFARERGQKPSVFNGLIRVARAFTCFQLTELILRSKRFLKEFPATVVIVSALPDLFFDEDVIDREARASFERALKGLRELASEQLAVAVFSDVNSFQTPRKDLFRQLQMQASRVLRIEKNLDGGLQWIPEKNAPQSLLSAR
jgi:hypothetical protein